MKHFSPKMKSQSFMNLFRGQLCCSSLYQFTIGCNKRVVSIVVFYAFILIVSLRFMSNFFKGLQTHRFKIMTLETANKRHFLIP